MRDGRSWGAALGGVLVVATILILPGLATPRSAGHERVAPAEDYHPAAGVEYVNLTDISSNWTSDFYSVAWPAGPYSGVALTITLTNFGDPWDRAEWVALDNVTLMDVTTLENTAGNNKVQSYSVNLTEWSTLFATPGHVRWAAMPDWISPCDAASPGCWTGELSFRFDGGVAPVGLPTVVPVFPCDTISKAAPWVNGTLRVPGSYYRAQAVLFQEGQSNDEFWYEQSFAGREFRWQWDNQTVLALVPSPFINSGGALGGVNDLYEWNGTPPPGTGSRPTVTADLTPWLPLLATDPWFNFTVVDNGDYWQVGLTLLLWGAPDSEHATANKSSVNQSLASRSAWVTGSAYVDFSHPFATESYNLSWSDYLNYSGSTIDLATAQTIVDRIDASTVEIERVSVQRTVFLVRVDSTNAVHVSVFANWTNHTDVTGNGQGSNLSENGAMAWTIDGSAGGLASVEHWSSVGAKVGDYSGPKVEFDRTWGWFQNRTASEGVGTSSPARYVSAGPPSVPLPGRFVVAPTIGSSVQGAVAVHLVAGPELIGASTVTVGNETAVVGLNASSVLNQPSLPNGTYALNVTTPTSEGLSVAGIEIEITGWDPPFVPPLNETMSVAARTGEAPWSTMFNGTVQGGTPPYLWLLTFGDGASANAPNARHLYASAGTYFAQLNVTDSAGRVAHAQVGVEVFPRLSVALSVPSSNWTVGAHVAVTAVPQGGDGPVTFSWGALPSTCRLQSAAVLSCAPSTTGTLSLKVVATDSLQYSALAQLNATVHGSAASPSNAPYALFAEVSGAAAVGIAVAVLVVSRRRGVRPER